MSVRRTRKFGAGMVLTGAAAAMLGVGAAHADDGTDQINGWAVTPTGGGVLSPAILTPATLSDPGNSLGLGTSPIAGEWISVTAAPLSSLGSNDQFSTLAQLGSSDNLFIDDSWLPGVEEATVETGVGNSVRAFLVPAAGDKQVVDLVNFTRGDTPPLFNPDATGPVDIGGLELASPHDGALLNNLFDALFLGDTAAWGNAVTLFDTWLGIDPSSATEAVDPGTLLPDLGF